MRAAAQSPPNRAVPLRHLVLHRWTLLRHWHCSFQEPMRPQHLVVPRRRRENGRITYVIGSDEAGGGSSTVGAVGHLSVRCLLARFDAASIGSGTIVAASYLC